ncbi:hypothetical protein [Kitasatospora sp. NPDC001175]|uniref:hypothetical protein n=1 Tax=Kitasatospora sp. NPDC001175 TaxID=3157103 RepID=UPI003D059F04
MPTSTPAQHDLRQLTADVMRELGQSYIECTGCPDTFHPSEISHRSGWPLCADCASEYAIAADRELTRQLATIA